MATKTQKRAQQEFDERLVDDPDLGSALSAMFEHQEAAKIYRDAVKEVRRIAVEVLDIKPDETIRSGEYIIPGVMRKGGGFAVREWERTTIGRVSADSGDTADD